MFNQKYRYAFIVLLAIYSYANANFSEVSKYYPLPGSASGLLFFFFLLIVLVWEQNRLIQLVVQRRPPFSSALYNLVTQFGISVAVSTLLSAGLAFGATRYLYHIPADRTGILLKLSILLGTRINLFLHVVNTLVFFSGQLKAKELETEALKRSHAQAQLQAIKNQLNPHFLFNNLNVLSALILKERPEANAFIEEFSIVYRHVLNTQQKELVSLQEELEFIQHYLFLLRQRFPESIEVDIFVPVEYHSFMIVPVALQLLIENAIKHNVASSTHPLRIDIRVEARYRLVVTNNLQPKTAVESSTQLGLKNIDQRYALICQQHLNIIRTDSVFSVSLPLISALP